MKKFIYGSFILLLAVLLVLLYTSERKRHDDLADQFSEFQEEKSALSEENLKLKEAIQTLEKKDEDEIDFKTQITYLTDELQSKWQEISHIRELYTSLVASQVALIDGQGLLEMPSNTGYYEDYTFMYIEPKDDLEENIQLIIDNLTTYYFIDLKMELMAIDEADILHINIIEEENTEVSWHTYFAGSTGGYITDLTMVESFLQRNYSGPWIKGVNLYFNGEDNYLTDHVSMFYGIYERSEDYFTYEPIE